MIVGFDLLWVNS